MVWGTEPHGKRLAALGKWEMPGCPWAAGAYLAQGGGLPLVYDNNEF